MKRGFTLIELLAVIVILAIISLIATPIILNIIEDVSKSGNVVSMQNIEKAAKLYFANKEKIENIVFECNEGICRNGKDILDINSKTEVEGKILIDKKGKITYEDLVINGYNCYKEHDKHVCDKNKVRKIFEENSIIINTSKESSLLDYNIYGDEGEVGDKTRNLISIPSISGDTLSTIIDCYLTFPFVVSAQEYPSLILNNEGAEANIWRILFTYLDGSTSYVMDSALKRIENSKIKASVENPIVSITYRGTYIRDGSYSKIQIEEGTIITEYEPYGYKIPIQVSGKNLFDLKTRTLGILSSGYLDTERRDFEFDKYYVGLTMNNYYDEARVISYSINDEKINLQVSLNGYGIGIPFRVKSNTRYSVSKEQGKYVGISFYTKDGEYISYTLSSAFITPENCEIINVVLRPEQANVETIYTNIQLEESDSSTQYEPYKALETNLYIKEPLRCIDEKCDYIDFKNQKVIRYIEKLEDDTLKVLNIPKEEYIELPDILLIQGFNNISIETQVSPSKIELEYYK